MDMAPAATEVVVVTGAVVQGGCVQQYAAAVAWVWQQAACVGGTAGGGGRGHDCNWWQAASVHVAVGSGCGVHATACSGVACVRQCAVAAVCVWQRVRAASSMIAMKQWWQLTEVVVQRAAVESYFSLTCGIFTQALCTRWFLEVRKRYSIFFPNI